MKKIAILLLLLMLVASVSACGSDSNGDKQEGEEKTEEKAKKSGKADIDWKEFTLPSEDWDGYTYDITYKLSPWILVDGNESLINSAWDEISDGEELPDFDDWGVGGHNSVQVSTGSSTIPFNHTSITDMYYCVGTIEIKNTTDGWDITESEPREAGYDISVIIDPDSVSGECDSISRTFYASDYEERANIIGAGATMKSNDWGPVPFVLMAPESFSPKYPDGEYFEKMLHSYFLKNTDPAALAQVGVIDKDGEYHDPELDEDEIPFPDCDIIE